MPCEIVNSEHVALPLLRFASSDQGEGESQGEGPGSMSRVKVQGRGSGPRCKLDPPTSNIQCQSLRHKKTTHRHVMNAVESDLVR